MEPTHSEMVEGAGGGQPPIARSPFRTVRRPPSPLCGPPAVGRAKLLESLTVLRLLRICIDP